MSWDGAPATASGGRCKGGRTKGRVKHTCSRRLRSRYLRRVWLNSSVRCSRGGEGKGGGGLGSQGVVGREPAARRRKSRGARPACRKASRARCKAALESPQKTRLNRVVQADDLWHGAPRQEGGDAREVLLRRGRGGERRMVRCPMLCLVAALTDKERRAAAAAASMPESREQLAGELPAHLVVL